MSTTIIDGIGQTVEEITANAGLNGTTDFGFIHNLVELITQNGTVGGALSGILPPVLNFLLTLALAVVVWILGMLILKLLTKVLDKLLTKNKVDKGVIHFIEITLKVLFIVLLIVLILGLFGVQTVSVAAVIAALGMTIGLALQGSLQNFAGGLLILISRPFRVGDFITLPDKNMGTVREISVIYTKLQTRDGRMIVIPNGTIANAQIINESRNGAIRLKTRVGIPYSQDIKVARKAIVDALSKDPKVITDKGIDCALAEFGESSLNLEVRIWANPKDYWPLSDTINETIREALYTAGVEIPYNQLDIHIIESEDKANHK